MAARRRKVGTPPLSGRWVHLFEEDGARGAVYVPDTTDVPLSRRPREVLEFDADGRAHVFHASPDDRLVEGAARWTMDGAHVQLDSPNGLTRRAILESPTRLLLLG